MYKDKGNHAHRNSLSLGSSGDTRRMQKGPGGVSKTSLAHSISSLDTASLIAVARGTGTGSGIGRRPSIRYTRIRPSQMSRDRANISFFLVVVFFGIFGVIVLTEVFLIDERSRARGRLGQGSPYGTLEVVQPFARRSGSLGADGGGAGAGRGSAAAHGWPENPPDYHGLMYLEQGNDVDEADRYGGRSASIANLSALNGVWQPVNSKAKFLVYSAYLDNRGDRVIRIIGATRTRGFERVFCRYSWPPATGVSSSTGTTSPPEQTPAVPAHVKVIRENWNLKYSAVFVLCSVRKDQSAPIAVSVVAVPSGPAYNLLAVQSTEPIKRSQPASAPPSALPLPAPQTPPPPLQQVQRSVGRRLPQIWPWGQPVVSQGRPRQHRLVLWAPDDSGLAVCVKPLHFYYNNALRILEFIEFNRILGAEHFYFYNHTVGPQVGCILRDYESRGMATVLPWQLKMESQREIRTEGQFAAFNDCVYRSMATRSYLALLDIDEFIVPRHNDTLLDLIQWLQARVGSRAWGSFSFQNGFFYLHWADDSNASKDSLPLVTQRKTKRKAKLHPHKQRSKIIIRPHYVVEVGNHFVWEFLSGHGAVNIHPSAAILQHYRVCEFGGEDCLLAPSIIDRTAQRFGSVLERRIRERWTELKETCQLPDVDSVAGDGEGEGGGEATSNASAGKPAQKPLAKCNGKPYC